jgi:hypothetical protein
MAKTERRKYWQYQQHWKTGQRSLSRAGSRANAVTGLDYSATSNYIDEEDHQRQYQQQVYQTAANAAH